MRYAGFTLIELLVVVIIMGVLTSIAMPQYRRAMDRSKAAEALQMLPAIFDSRERFITQNPTYHWDGNVLRNEENATVVIAFRFLDIESKGRADHPNPGKLTTRNFEYNLVDPAIKTLSGAPGVSAAVKWSAGAEGRFKGVKFHYNGQRTCCTGEITPCQRLNVDICGE